MAELPLWAIYVVSFGTPLSALAGVLISVWIGGVRHRTEVFHRHLEWASQLALSDDERKQYFGAGQLEALSTKASWSRADRLLLREAIQRATIDYAERVEAEHDAIAVVDGRDVSHTGDAMSEGGEEE